MQEIEEAIERRFMLEEDGQSLHTQVEGLVFQEFRPPSLTGPYIVWFIDDVVTVRAMNQVTNFGRSMRLRVNVWHKANTRITLLSLGQKVEALFEGQTLTFTGTSNYRGKPMFGIQGPLTQRRGYYWMWQMVFRIFVDRPS